ncbi:MAG: RNA polymerase Rpb4 [Nitrososphaerota archaeon]|nr:RNA polymerase Rpb4 [Nitrososphaerota archaeon]MDG6922755.1 RNA polymerase Rpb4 [Nitrososphaerota archaeon]
MAEQSQEQVQRKARIITIAEAKDILSKIDPEQTDQIQKRTMDYLMKFSKVEAEKSKKIRKSLTEECGLTIAEATELINIMPKSQEELRVFTAGWRKLIPTATVERILKILYD